ncbi:Ger(x)C family spore germination protein [Paenibacillus alkaliterrae]|uniref:Ger(x)C family spore germination protein n=1 Tax=Paenibacillus alkaliterrae TaxID=320909 RepID=UPI001F1AD2DE|nr:Ger(x)C family spore germination protein [Paenibacillus alkaliterrae]MCF2940342.1 Ger(x)C family spore germination protein [Paenibacillus alkaliterrae]
MEKIKITSAILLLSLLIAGCGDQRILEKQAFTMATSYDLAPKKEGESEDKLLVAIDIPKADPEERMQRETLTAVAHTSKEARIKFAGQTELSIVSGQLRDTLFGIALAKNGIWEHIDTLVRDPSISQGVKVSVVKGSAHDLLVRNYPQHPRTGQYIDRMLDKEAAVMTIPTVTIYDFTRDYFDDGIDPVAPILKEGEKNISIDGIALFNKDRYVAKIEPEKSLIFAFLRQNFRRGEISMALFGEGEKKERLMFTSISNKRKIHVKRGGNNQIMVEIMLNIKGSVLEYTGKLKMSEEKDRKKLEKLMADYVMKEASIMVGKMQKHNVDSLGIGKYVRNSMSYKEWSTLGWHEVYPNVKVQCKANIKIKDFGKFK